MLISKLTNVEDIFYKLIDKDVLGEIIITNNN